MLNVWLLHTCLLLLAPLASISHASCIPQTITGDDARFCSDDFHVVYPGIGDVSCRFIPFCLNYTRSLVNVWGPPEIKYPNAQRNKTYTLMMVDPDAPNRNNPTRKYWRHWVVSEIQGPDLITGTSLRGRVLSGYSAPSPPANAGYHRYQFHLYLQDPGSSPSLLPTEEKSLGNWDPDAFALRWNLGDPVATTQFMAQNHQQKDLSF